MVKQLTWMNSGLKLMYLSLEVSLMSCIKRQQRQKHHPFTKIFHSHSSILVNLQHSLEHQLQMNHIPMHLTYRMRMMKLLEIWIIFLTLQNSLHSEMHSFKKFKTVHPSNNTSSYHYLSYNLGNCLHSRVFAYKKPGLQINDCAGSCLSYMITNGSYWCCGRDEGKCLEANFRGYWFHWGQRSQLWAGQCCHWWGHWGWSWVQCLMLCDKVVSVTAFTQYLFILTVKRSSMDEIHSCLHYLFNFNVTVRITSE